jgi:hypothetical protein
MPGFLNYAENFMHQSNITFRSEQILLSSIDLAPAVLTLISTLNNYKKGPEANGSGPFYSLRFAVCKSGIIYRQLLTANRQPPTD